MKEHVNQAGNQLKDSNYHQNCFEEDRFDAAQFLIQQIYLPPHLRS